jgi:cardiolipin synthase A/B
VMLHDAGVAAAMEEMYAADLEHAREIRLSGARLRPRPTRRLSRAERRGRRDQPTGSGVGRGTMTQMRAVWQTARGVDIERAEQMVAATLGASLLGLGLLGARFPRLVAWPFAAAASLYGGSALARAMRPLVLGALRHGRDRPRRPRGKRFRKP